MSATYVAEGAGDAIDLEGEGADAIDLEGDSDRRRARSYSDLDMEAARAVPEIWTCMRVGGAK